MGRPRRDGPVQASKPAREESVPIAAQSSLYADVVTKPLTAIGEIESPKRARQALGAGPHPPRLGTEREGHAAVQPLAVDLHQPRRLEAQGRPAAARAGT